MSEGHSSPYTDGLPVAPTSESAAQVLPAPPERVALGLLTSLVAVVVGVVLTVVIWRAGYVASITSLVIAAGAVYGYSLAAGTAPRKGLIPVVLIVALGVVLSFFAVVASDLVDAYDQMGIAKTGISQADFIRDNIFNSELLRRYSEDMGMFLLFAVLGVFGTLRSLFKQG
jgi:uncharacterized membrane protein YgcG